MNAQLLLWCHNKVSTGAFERHLSWGEATEVFQQYLLRDGEQDWHLMTLLL